MNIKVTAVFHDGGSTHQVVKQTIDAAVEGLTCVQYSDEEVSILSTHPIRVNTFDAENISKLYWDFDEADVSIRKDGDNIYYTLEDGTEVLLTLF